LYCIVLYCIVLDLVYISVDAVAVVLLPV